METIKLIKQLLSEYSMEMLLFVAGAFGVAYTDRINPELTLKEKISRMFFGGVCAMFVTPFFVEIIQNLFTISFSQTAQNGIAFLIGHLGLEAFTIILVKLPELKDKFKIFKTKE